jgi:hypothetical protein
MTDPYFDTDVCVDRLMREYHAHGKLIVAVDFDDTVFDFHKSGHSYPEIINLLERCQKLGFYIVLFTGSDPSEWDKQCGYLLRHGIHAHAVNQNPIPLPFGNHGKMYYNILLDDRAGLGQAYRTLVQVLKEIEEENK